MNFIPHPGKVEIETIERDSVILSDTSKYEEMGRVLSVGEGVTWLKAGDVVFFLAYGVEQTPEYDGKVHYVVPATEKFIIGKCTTNEASVSMGTYTITESAVNSEMESRKSVSGAKTDSSSTSEFQTEST